MRAIHSVVLLCATLAATLVLGGQADKVRLTDITALTFQAGAFTAARRSKPISQLTCVSGPCRSVDIRTVQCKNVGDAGGGDIQWHCTANMPNGIDFDGITVSCEGYDNPDDPFVLKGSCGLEYGLMSTGNGNGGASSGRQYGSYARPSSPSVSSDEESGFPWIFLLFVAGAIWFIFFRKPNTAPPADGGRTTGYSGGGGGGGGGGYYGGGGGGGGGTQYRSGYGSYTQTQYEQPPPQQPQQQGNGGWRFVQGLLGGALLANMFAPRQQYYMRPNYGYDTGLHTNYGGGGGGFFGGGGGGASAGTHTSSGFGGTRRR